MEAKELLLYALPSLGLAVLALLLLAVRTLRLSQKVQRYELDKYRHELEQRIAELSQQLTISDERFRQINHLLLDAQTASRSMGPGIAPGEFFERLRVDLSIQIDTELVFVLMPFNPEFEEVYEALSGVVQAAGFRCARGDEEFVSSNILGHILQEVVRARLVIADITGRNPNVFYELGIAHALGKPVLLIAQAERDIPFDVGSIRVLIYKGPRELSASLNKWLVRTLATSA